MQPQFFEGQRIGKYKVLKPCLGSGGSGVVLLAEDQTGKLFALKMITVGDRLAAFEKFKTEHKNLALLPSHPNIAACCDFGLHDDTAYIVTEYIDGENLFEAAYNLSPADSVRLFLDALEGLDFIHRNGILHLDIKPENILVQRPGGAVKIIDLGIASAMDGHKKMGQGTFPFIAPEIVTRTDDPASICSDLFSFAATMYYCLTRGELPFPFRNRAVKNGAADFELLGDIIKNETDPPPVSNFRAGVPPHITEILRRLLAKNPRDRNCGSARAVINAIRTKMPDAFLETQGVAAAYLIPEGNRHVGRETLQEKLSGWLRDLADNPSFQPPVVFISGGAGIGKSHLLRKTAEAAAEKIESLCINCLSFPADDIWCMDFATTLDKRMADNEKPVIVLVDDIHEFAATFERDPSNPATNAVKKVITGLASLCLARKQSPETFDGVMPVFVCFAFDDDCSSFDKIAGLFGIPKNLIEKMTLKPFTLAELDSYLKSTPAFKQANLPREWVDNLRRDTGGVPAAVKERLEIIDSRGLLFDLDGNIVLNPAIAPQMPPTAAMKDRFLNQVAGCRPEERVLLEAMAVWDFKHLAPPITRDDLCHITPVSHLRQSIDCLIQRGLIETSSSPPSMGGDKGEGDSARLLKFVSRNCLPALIYDGMQKKDRELWHMKIRQHLADHGGDEDVMLLHVCHGSEGKIAARAAMKLGNRLMQRGSVRMAGEIFERGLEISFSQPKLFACFAVAAISALQQEGTYAKARSLYEKAMRMQDEEKGRMWRALLKMRIASIATEQRFFDEAFALLKETQDVLRNFPPTTLLVTAINCEARGLYERAFTGRDERISLLERAKALYKKSSELEEALPENARIRVQNNSQGIVLIALGDFSGAIAEMEKKLARHEKAGDLLGAAFSTMAISDAHRLAGDPSSALPFARRAAKLARQTGQVKWLAHAHELLASILHDANRFREALDEDNAYLASSAFLEGAGERSRIASAIWAHKGHCHKELGEFDKAITHFQAALDMKPDPFLAMSAHEGMGEVFLKQGNFSGSIFHLDAAQKLLDAMPKDAAPTYRNSVRKFRTLAVESMESSLQK